MSAQPTVHSGTTLLGNSRAILAIKDSISPVAKARLAVMLLGEAGVEKDSIAAAIHKLSPRSHGPFIKMSCAAQSENSLSSELFGHESDAFPGAIGPRMGLLERTNGGTLFLDEIGEMPLAIQVKLLRVLRDGEFRRIGGTSMLQADIRLICATSRDLKPAVDRGEFNPDLFYRLSVLPIFIPPLRERQGDIPLLAREILRKFNEEQGSRLTFSQAALDFLSKFPFPGNVYQLENLVLRVAALVTEDEISEEDCLALGQDHAETAFPSAAPGLPSPYANIELRNTSATSPQPSRPDLRFDAADDRPNEADGRIDREKLIDAMIEAGWVQARAGRLLGLTPRQIGYALKKHNISIRKF